MKWNMKNEKFTASFWKRFRDSTLQFFRFKIKTKTRKKSEFLLCVLTDVRYFKANIVILWKIWSLGKKDNFDGTCFSESSPLKEHFPTSQPIWYRSSMVKEWRKDVILKFFVIKKSFIYEIFIQEINFYCKLLWKIKG